MAYDEHLANRLRQLIGSEAGLAEKKVFGGLAFLINGNMAIAASAHGGLLIHINPSQTDKLLASTKAEPMEMHGRNMSGWLRVSTKDVSTDEELTSWVELGVTYAQSLPPKDQTKHSKK